MSQPPQFPNQPQSPFQPAGNPHFRPPQPQAKPQPVYRLPSPREPGKRRWWKSPRFLAPLTFLVGLMLGFSTGAVAMSSPEARAPRPTKTVTMPAATVTATTTATTTQTPETTPTPTATQQASTTAPAPASTAPAPATTAPETGQYGQYPPAEAAFVTEVQAASGRYQAAKTDLQRSQAMRDRNKNLYNIMGGLKVTNWVGVIHDVGANGEGKAYVSIEIADGVLVHTWNNAFSDSGDGTLIPQASPFFQTLVNAAPGDKVVFSGTFFADPTATLRTTNLTETFSVLTPEFLVKFSAIAKQ